MLLARAPEFRNFVEYLKKNPPRFPVDAGPVRTALASSAGFAAGVATTPVWLLASMGLLGGSQPPAVVGGAAFAGSIVAAWLTFRAVRKKIPVQDPAQQAAQRKRAESLRDFHDLMNQRKLGEKVDPMVIQMLEASAVHYHRVQALALGPHWGKGATGHRAALRDQVLKASEEAMDELVELGRSCIGEPVKKDQMTDLLDGMTTFDFADAIGKLKGMVSADAWVDRAYRSPNAPLVFEPMRDIAQRLKALADELEQAPALAGAEQETTLRSSLAIDSLLAEVRAVREAEEELNQRP